jgi:glycerol kinase
MNSHVLVIDQGTTSTRTILFDRQGAAIASAQQEFRQIYPHPGWVEHDPEDIWATALATAREALAKAGLRAEDISSIGIANQRETTLVWSREDGVPIYNAIVWQDRRTAEACEALKSRGAEPLVSERTGLLIDPYFSATKIGWMLDNVPGARRRAERGELAFGTVDTFLLWRLSGGATHATDATNASRTLLFDIHKGVWDEDLLRLFGVPRALLPEVRNTGDDFGVSAKDRFGRELPIAALIGDQQAGLIGQACLTPGQVKATYGTGAFFLLNAGPVAPRSRHRLLTTIAYQWKGRRAYALEGSIFSAGASVQWLRDSLGVIDSAAQAGALAAEADPSAGVYLVPAFVGLGAPHWRSDARAVISGLTRGSTRRELARAALESVGFQSLDLLNAMQADVSNIGVAFDTAAIRVDGGMASSDWTLQFLADIAGRNVERPRSVETTALGAALVAGWMTGLYPAPETLADRWTFDRRFTGSMPQAERDRRLRGWREAVARALLSGPHEP